MMVWHSIIRYRRVLTLAALMLVLACPAAAWANEGGVAESQAARWYASNPRTGLVELFGRDGGGGHPAAGRVHGAQGEAAPPGPDLEDIVGWRQRQRPADPIDLPGLRRLE
jgi:hypothetical protein